MGGFLWFYEKVEWLVREMVFINPSILVAENPVTDPFFGLVII